MGIAAVEFVCARLCGQVVLICLQGDGCLGRVRIRISAVEFRDSTARGEGEAVAQCLHLAACLRFGLGLAAVEFCLRGKAAARDGRRAVRHRCRAVDALGLCIGCTARNGDVAALGHVVGAALDGHLAVRDLCHAPRRAAAVALLGHGETADDAPLRLRGGGVELECAVLDGDLRAGDLCGAAMLQPCVCADGTADRAAVDDRLAARICTRELDRAVGQADLPPRTCDGRGAVVAAREIVDLGRCPAAVRADGDGRRRAVRAARDAFGRHGIRRDRAHDGGIGKGVRHAAERERTRRECGEDARHELP